VQYLNNVLEQDHRAIPTPGAREPTFSFILGSLGVRRAGYEAVQMIRKGQACWSATGAKVGLLHRFIVSLFAATN
jgi:hypothetical protein